MFKPTPSQVRLPLPIRPRGGAIGAEVQLSATGLAPNVRHIIAFANLTSYQLVGRVTTDQNGGFAIAQRVPDWAELDRVHYFFAALANEIPLAFSHGFHVTAADGTGTVTGWIGDRAEGCVDLRDVREELYHLTGDIGERKPNDRVVVRGTIAESTPCSGTGIVIAVRDVRVPV
jgi:hypothetical protein